MKIQSTNINICSNRSDRSNKTAFGHKSAFAYLKNIKGNRCACCGNEMILSKEIAETWGKITRPLKVLMEEGRFNFAETVYPGIYKVLTDFVNKYPNDSLDNIISQQDNHYEFLSSIADSFEYDSEYKKLSGARQQKKVKNRTMEFLKISSAILKDSAEIIKNLKPFEPYLRGYRKDIFQELEMLSEKYPDKKINEIIKLPEVATNFIENNYYEAVNFAKIRDEHWNKADKIILDKKPELKIPLNKLRKKICLIYRGIVDPARVSYEITKEYKNFLDQYKLDEIKKSVISEIKQMPTSLFSKNSFLAFARRYYTDGEIINYVIKPFMESVEHINTVRDGGSNDSANIIMMCRQCNIDRGGYPYSEHLAIHPEMIKNTELQIKFYADRILSGELPETLERYPIEVAKTLFKCSDGIMKYNVDYYIKAMSHKHNGINS